MALRSDAAADVASITALLEEKVTDARSQSQHGDARDRDYWNGKADAFNWAIGALNSGAWSWARMSTTTARGL